MRLVAGDALMRFAVSAPHEERFAEFYTGETRDAGKTYLFAQDAGSEDISFCRRVFHRDFAHRTVSPTRAQTPCYTVDADESRAVHFSCFYPIATHSQRWLRITLHAPQTDDYAFQLATCGGVRIWVGEEEAACFTPFTRNTLQICQAMLPLRQGENRLLIHLEELCERDTQTVFRMMYQGNIPLEATLSKLDEALPTLMVKPEEAWRDDAQTLLTLLAEEKDDPRAGPLLIRALQRISAREEGSSHILVSLLHIWQRYRGEHFPPVLWRRVRSAVLGYRYWFDELGNDVMWFTRAENALSFHTAQYLAGQFFGDERFTASGRTGREQQQIALQRLLFWFEHAPVQEGAIPSLTTLSQLADDPALRACAQRLLTSLKPNAITCPGDA
jgi:hypothetical protein